METDLKTTPEERTFVERAFTSQQVHGLAGPDGWRRLQDENGQSLLVFFSHRSYAERFQRELPQTTISPIPLNAFINDVLAELVWTDVIVVLDPNPSDRWLGKDPEQLYSLLVSAATKRGLPQLCESSTDQTEAPKLITERSESSVTFKVDEVTPATEPLRVKKGHQVLKRYLGSDLDSCSDYHGDVVARVEYHPFFAAANLAYSEHRPLVLTPDAVWLVVAQGFAHHVLLHAEALRHRFVSHAGKLKLTVEVRGFVKNSPENPWAEVVDQFARKVEDHLIAECSFLTCDFSTSGPVERAASQIAIMEAFQKYFDYELGFICGIPQITILGTSTDWRRLREKAAHLDQYELGWYTSKLLPICDEFVHASEGRIHPRFWRRLFRRRSEYGTTRINGWICHLLPYVCPSIGACPSLRNPMLTDSTNPGLTTDQLPLGLSTAPFRCVNLQTERAWPMEFLGGFTGVEQDAATLALRPKIGWAVREAGALDQALTAIRKDHKIAIKEPKEAPAYQPEMSIPAELVRFYTECDGATIHGRFTLPACADLSVEKLDGQEDGDEGVLVCRDSGGGAYILLRGRGNATESTWPVFHRPCLGTPRKEWTQVAASFAEFLTWLLKQGSQPS